MVLVLFFPYGSVPFDRGLLRAGQLQGRTRPNEDGHIGDAFELVKKSLSYAGVRFISLAAFALLLGYIGLMTFVADYLKESFSLRSDKLGLILSMTGFSGILTSPIAGFLGDRFGRTSVAVGGGVLMIIAVLGLAMVQYTYSKYLWLFFLFGVGSATTWTSLNTLAVELIPHLRKPVSSVYNSFKYFGYALSPLVLSYYMFPFPSSPYIGQSSSRFWSACSWSPGCAAQQAEKPCILNCAIYQLGDTFDLREKEVSED